jgi:glycine/D-amino acid oxidase-like deaminating enzyme
VDKGILIPKAGSIDIDRLVQFYETEIRRMHVEIRYNTEAETVIAEPEESLGMPSEPLFWQESGVTGVSTSTGKIRAKKTIIAAGVWTNSLLNEVGIYSPMEPLKRQLFSVRASTPELKQLLHTKGFNNRDSLPFTILPNPKVYMKPALEEEAFWLGYGDHFPRAYQLEEDPQPEENFYRYGIYQVASKYLPQFVGAHSSSSWAGQYALNTIDGQPVIFEQNNLIVVGSCSGSGNMKCDAIGRIAAALYAGEEYTQLPGSERFKTSDLGLKNRNAEPEKLII